MSERCSYVKNQNAGFSPLNWVREYYLRLGFTFLWFCVTSGAFLRKLVTEFLISIMGVNTKRKHVLNCLLEK